MLAKSFHSVGLNEILKAVQVPKGSFYHYFDSKEQFGVEMLRHYLADANAYKRGLLLDTSTEVNPRRRLLTLLESNVARFLEHGGKCPCLVMKLASEVASFSEAMRQVLADGQAEWVRIIEQVIREGFEKEAIAELRDAVLTAGLIDALWCGAMQGAIISRRPDPLRSALDFIARDLIPAP